jgi:predicted alpha/beta hydrolase family esterase
MTDTRVLLLPGLYNSGPQHWQSVWEREHPSFQRLQQRDWDTPDRSDWVATLQDAIAASTTPVILVAHSLACCLVAHWSAEHTGPVQGALLVAPSDVEADSYPSGTTGFAPMPLNRLPFPSIVLASTDDPHVSVERARQFAEAWGARFEVVGALGHINSASELGGWAEGWGFLDELRS